MIAKEIQEMRDALQAFQTAIEAGEVAGLTLRFRRSVRMKTLLFVHPRASVIGAVDS